MKSRFLNNLEYSIYGHTLIDSEAITVIWIIHTAYSNRDLHVQIEGSRSQYYKVDFGVYKEDHQVISKEKEKKTKKTKQ